MRKLKRIAALILVLVAVLVILQNTQPVETYLVFTSVEMPRAVLLLITLGIGFALGLATSGKFRRNSKK